MVNADALRALAALLDDVMLKRARTMFTSDAAGLIASMRSVKIGVNSMVNSSSIPQPGDHNGDHSLDHRRIC